MLSILFIEDLPSDVDLAVLELKKEKFIFKHKIVCTKTDLLKALNEFRPDLIISDYLMPSFNGLQALKIAKEFDPEIPFIIYTGSVNEETAVECLKSGAEDYIIKEHMTRLPFAVKEVLDQATIKKEKKASELLLRDSEEKLQSIFSAAPVGIGLVIDRKLIELNDEVCNITGYTRNELIGQSSAILYPTKDEYESVGTEKYRQIAEKGIGLIETRIKHKNGKILNVILSSSPLDKNDHSKGVTFTILDITARENAEKALRESEEKFRSIAENLSDIIFITDLDGVIKYISPSSISVGYHPEECIGRFFGDFLSTGEMENAKKIFINALNSINIDSSVSLVFKRKDGTDFFAELSGSPFVIGNEVSGVLGLLRDVSDKMKRDSELRKLSRAVDQSTASIVITDTEGNIEYVNSKLCEITGYSRDELLGMNPSLMSSGEASKDVYKILWDTIRAGNEWKGEFHNRKKNGELYWENATISPIKNDKDEITHFLGIKEDITFRKDLEAANIQSEKRYRELFLNNPVPTYIFNEETLKFIEVNDATVENYGFSREEFSSMTLRDIRPPEDLDALLESVKNLGKEVFHSTVMSHKTKMGRIFPVEITSHSLPEKNGQKTRLVIAIDITERIYAAEQMKIAKEKAEASDRLKTTFLNNISHEVRTPLNGILGFAEIISKTDLTEEEKNESISMLYESSDRLLNTITNYMDISLITSGNMTALKKNISPIPVVKNIYGYYETLCKKRRLKLYLEIPDNDPDVLINTDPEILKKILSHLLNNAVKFTEKGSIHYGYMISGGELEFFVKDTGIGIKEESINNIFDKFVKEDRGNSKFSEGSGLGLSIVRGLCDILGCTINIKSDLNSGSTFSFKIQLMTDVIEGSFNTNNNSKKVSSRSKILIAEDDETNFFYLNAILTRDTDFKILHAKNGVEAIELFNANPDIKLILMDIKMPEVDGLEATRQIKKINKEVPVVAVTAYAMLGDEEKLLAAGCDGYLSKPITKGNLMEKISEFITS